MADARAIGFVEPASGRQSDLALQSHPQVVATIGAWAESLGYDAAIWTALTSNFDEWGKGGEPFSVSAALQYLETLEGEDPAKFAQALAYIRKAPPEVETPVREEVAKRWRWVTGRPATPSPLRRLTLPGRRPFASFRRCAAARRETPGCRSAHRRGSGGW